MNGDRDITAISTRNMDAPDPGRALASGDCEQCDGRGFIDICWNGNPDREDREQCKACDGTGERIDPDADDIADLIADGTCSDEADARDFLATMRAEQQPSSGTCGGCGLEECACE